MGELEFGSPLDYHVIQVSGVAEGYITLGFDGDTCWLGRFKGKGLCTYRVWRFLRNLAMLKKCVRIVSGPITDEDNPRVEICYKAGRFEWVSPGKNWPNGEWVCDLKKVRVSKLPHPDQPDKTPTLAPTISPIAPTIPLLETLDLPESKGLTLLDSPHGPSIEQIKEVLPSPEPPLTDSCEPPVRDSPI